MSLKKGDIVVCTLSGDYGKPRPAVVVQSDLFNLTHSSIVICPITSYLVDTPLFRLELKPSKRNGLEEISQIMIDKITALKKDKISKKIGNLSLEEERQLNNALKLWMDL